MNRVTKALLAGATVLAAVAATAVPVSAAQQVERPYKAEGTGTSIVDVSTCVPVGPGIFQCDQRIEQTVIGTHIGRSSRTGTGHIVLDFTPAGFCIGSDGHQGTSFVSNITTDTIVAANGDELRGSSTAQGCFVDSEHVTLVSGTWTVHDGTGRFDGATGGGTISAISLGDALSNSWVGTLTY